MKCHRGFLVRSSMQKNSPTRFGKDFNLISTTLSSCCFWEHLMMARIEFKSGENTFIWPRNSVGARTSATTTIECESTDCTIPLNQLKYDEIWIPRAQGFLFSLDVIIDKRISIHSPLALTVPEVVSHYVERAEVSKMSVSTMLMKSAANQPSFGID